MSDGMQKVTRDGSAVPEVDEELNIVIVYHIRHRKDAYRR